MTHPLADATTPPSFSAITPEAIGPVIAAVLAERDATAEHLVRTAPQGFSEAWLPLIDRMIAVDGAASIGAVHGGARGRALPRRT